MATERGSMAADLDMHAMAVDAAARSGDESGLESYLAVAEESAARAKHNLYIAVARRARGISYRLTGEYDDASEQLAAAVDEFRALDTQWQIGRTLLELGEVEQNRGNADLARTHFSEALTAFEGLNADPDAARARAALEALS
jgi:tetratricopeptide (TPR) repeat protein